MERLAKCLICGTFYVPWGDHIGPALMEQHLADHKKRGEDLQRRDQSIRDETESDD